MGSLVCTDQGVPDAIAAPSCEVGRGLSAAAAWDTLRSPETYVGYARSERRTKLSADRLSLNRWALAGRWTVDEESAVLDAAAGSIAFRFEGRDLNLVMTADAADAARPRTFEITFLDPGVRAYLFTFG